jgi:hypothetical protein
MTTSASPEPDRDDSPDAWPTADLRSPLAAVRATLEEQREHLEQLTARRSDLAPALLDLTARTNRALHRLEAIEARLVRSGEAS